MSKPTITHTAPQARDFSATERKALLAKGIAIVGATAVPAFDGDVYFSGRGYILNDNDTQRIRAYRDVVALARED